MQERQEQTIYNINFKADNIDGGTYYQFRL